MRVPLILITKAGISAYRPSGLKRHNIEGKHKVTATWTNYPNIHPDQVDVGRNMASMQECQLCGIKERSLGQGIVRRNWEEMNTGLE